MARRVVQTAPQELYFWLGGMSEGDAARTVYKLIDEDKAQNDVRLVSNVGHGVTPKIVRYH